MLNWQIGVAHLLPRFETVHDLESCLHINLLEMMADERTLDHWLPMLQDLHIQILSDNITVRFYLEHQRGMQSKDLCTIAVIIADKLHVSKIHLSCCHIPGRLTDIGGPLKQHPPCHGMDSLSEGVHCFTEQVPKHGGKSVCNREQQSTPSICFSLPRQTCSRE